jgi:hypothetical protein
MFKGLRGFIYVGGYILPLFASLFAIYTFQKIDNIAAMIWAGLTIFWIINAFLNNIAMKQWKALYIRSQALCDDMILYIHSQQEVIENGESKDKDSQESTKA